MVLIDGNARCQTPNLDRYNCLTVPMVPVDPGQVGVYLSGTFDFSQNRCCMLLVGSNNLLGHALQRPNRMPRSQKSIFKKDLESKNPRPSERLTDPRKVDIISCDIWGCALADFRDRFRKEQPNFEQQRS